MGNNMKRLERIVAELPEAIRVDIAEWGDHPTFRVRNKNFVFSDDKGESLSVKLDKTEAAAVVATDPDVDAAGYGLGRHGWVSISVAPNSGDERWELLREWIRTSYILVAPKSLAAIVLAQDEHMTS
jgi:predicted DNA-binding protein (MmcQ/YjbR family)